MRSLANLSIKKGESVAATERGAKTGEVIGDISVESLDQIKDLANLEVSSTGHIDIGELDVEEIDFEKMTNDPTDIDTESHTPELDDGIVGPTAGGGGKAPEIPPQTLFIKSDTLVNAFLHGVCGETLNMLIHILAHASEAMTVNLSYCSPTIGKFETIELIGAISMTKATVNIDLLTADSPVELLMFTTNANISLADGYRVAPITSFSHGNVSNMAQVVQAEMEYIKYIFETLQEAKILTTEDATKLIENDDIIYLDGEELAERLK